MTDQKKATEQKRRKLLALKGSSKGLSYALEALKDGSWRVRKTALDVLLSEYKPQQYINELIRLLYLEDNAGARNAAIEALTRLGSIAVPHLIKAFETDNRDVRKFIIDVLGTIGGRDTLPVLLRAIKDEDDNVRASAVEYLGRLKESQVVDALIEIIDSGDTWTAYPAVDALGRIGDRRAIPYLLKTLTIRPLTEPSLKALARFSEPETLKAIIPLLLDKRRSIQEETIRTIEQFYKSGLNEEYIVQQIQEHLGKETFNILLQHTKSNNPEVKASAILLLGLLKDTRAINSLLELSDEEEFRDIVKRSLLYIGKTSPEVLLPLLEKEIPNRRRLITDVIADLRNPFFYKHLLSLLKDRDGHVVSYAARGLGWIGDKEAVTPLVSLLSHPYPDVQASAVEALQRLSQYLNTEELIQNLKSDSSFMRKNMALILGKLLKERDTSEASKIIEALGFTLKDPDTEVRKAALIALSKTPPGSNLVEEVKRHMKRALTDETPEVRAIATEAIAQFKGDDILDFVLLMTKDTDENVRAVATRALSRFADKKALSRLVELLDDPNGYVVIQAIEALAHFPSRNARKQIVRMLKSDDREIQRTAILSLSSFPESINEIKAFVFSDDWATRLASVQALAKINTPDALSILEEVYDSETDPTVRKAIEGALGV